MLGHHFGVRDTQADIGQLLLDVFEHGFTEVGRLGAEQVVSRATAHQVTNTDYTNLLQGTERLGPQVLLLVIECRREDVG